MGLSGSGISLRITPTCEVGRSGHLDRQRSPGGSASMAFQMGRRPLGNKGLCPRARTYRKTLARAASAHSPYPRTTASTASKLRQNSPNRSNRNAFAPSESALGGNRVPPRTRRRCLPPPPRAPGERRTPAARPIPRPLLPATARCAWRRRPPASRAIMRSRAKHCDTMKRCGRRKRSPSRFLRKC